mmetsp:Transcript_3593/g.6072  ORF Transcript_3593/g.6072 Transcript_3593/m.6072 type:complete len:212 (+) Transcript_3593:2797-3432(+)
MMLPQESTHRPWTIRPPISYDRWHHLLVSCLLTETRQSSSLTLPHHCHHDYYYHVHHHPHLPLLLPTMKTTPTWPPQSSKQHQAVSNWHVVSPTVLQSNIILLSLHYYCHHFHHDTWQHSASHPPTMPSNPNVHDTVHLPHTPLAMVHVDHSNTNVGLNDKCHIYPRVSHVSMHNCLECTFVMSICTWYRQHWDDDDCDCVVVNWQGGRYD